MGIADLFDLHFIPYRGYVIAVPPILKVILAVMFTILSVRVCFHGVRSAASGEGSVGFKAYPTDREELIRIICSGHVMAAVREDHDHEYERNYRHGHCTDDTADKHRLRDAEARCERIGLSLRYVHGHRIYLFSARSTKLRVSLYFFSAFGTKHVFSPLWRL